jgi:2-oxoisovalerate dehydrogenase E2 component (dihydrolipoyl transacylase)
VIYEVIIPKVGMGITEVDLIEWHVRVGDSVNVGDPLVKIDAEKTEQDLLSDVAGLVKEITHGAEEAVEVGTVICRIETP